MTADKIKKAAFTKAKAAVRKYKRDLVCVETVLVVNFPSLTRAEVIEITDAAFTAVPCK